MRTLYTLAFAAIMRRTPRQTVRSDYGTDKRAAGGAYQIKIQSIVPEGSSVSLRGELANV